MMYRACGLVVCLLAWTAFCGPVFSIGANVGGTASMVTIDKTPQGINVDQSKWVGYFAFGLAAEAAFNEYIGAGIGVGYEKRGGIAVGNLSVGSWSLFNGEIEYDYRYLQIPLYIKGTLPLRIPGRLFITLGPELGVKMESEATLRIYNSNFSQTDKIDTLTGAVDFALSGTFGYELPLLWFGGLRAYVGYCQGFIDIYENKVQSTSDYDIYNRAFKYGLSFYVNINSPRRP
jgi:hypothetical protein